MAPVDFDFDAGVFFRSVNLRHLCTLVVALLCEQKVVMISERLTLLAVGGEVLRFLLRPLVWTHMYVPLLPRCMAQDFLECPTPFLVGLPKSYCRGIHLPPDAIKIDLDTSHCWGPETASNGGGAGAGGAAGTMGYAPLARVMARLMGLCNPDFDRLDQPDWRGAPGGAADNFWAPQPPPAAAVVAAFRDCLEDLLRGAGECCFPVGRGKEQVTLFDERLFGRLKRDATAAGGSWYEHSNR
ncbi:unnamed protein product, partial [Phaeothamnion confervicola]